MAVLVYKTVNGKVTVYKSDAQIPDYVTGKIDPSETVIQIKPGDEGKPLSDLERFYPFIAKGNA